MKTRPGFFYRQSGVVPVRLDGERLEVLLVTTRRSGRWTIPKGIVDPGRTPVDSAVKEAYEEAGVRGVADAAPIGSYRYRKWGGECVVEVFRLVVDEELESWPEAHERTRRWMSPADAADVVANAELRALLRALSRD